MEKRLHRKGWGRGGWKVEGHRRPHGCSRLPKIPGEGKTPQKTEAVGLSVNKWLFPQRHLGPGASGQSFPALFGIHLLHQLLVLSVWALSVSISQSQPGVPISDGLRSGRLLLTEQFSMQTMDWCFPRLGLNLPWTPPKRPLHILFIPALFFFFPLMGYFEASLTTCGLYTPCFYAVALTFPTWNIFRARSYSPPFPLCSQGVTPCWNIPMFRSK